MTLAARVSAALEAAVQATEKHSTQQIRRNALESGWDREAAKNLRAKVNSNGMVSASFEGAEDWEYGTMSRPPLAVARSFENRVETDVDADFERALMNGLGGIL